MNTALKITKIGNSAGIILPKEVLAQLNARVGDKLAIVTTESGIELIARQADAEDQLAMAQEVMARRKRAMMALADAIMDEDREILKALSR